MMLGALLAKGVQMEPSMLKLNGYCLRCPLSRENNGLHRFEMNHDMVGAAEGQECLHEVGGLVWLAWSGLG